MVDFVERRLQVFVSSTYMDLKEERQAAVSTILKAGHIPAGMELFSSGNESQMEVIKQWIDQSDVYLLILGARYGTIDKKEGKSYTHLEYEYALSTNKPLFACVISDKGIDEKVTKDGRQILESDETQKYKDFKVLVTSNIVEFWDDIKDIKITVSNKMGEYSRDNSLIGWVRPDKNIDTASISEEIARLSKENNELRSLNKSKDDILGLTFNELVQNLNSHNLLTEFLSIVRQYNGDYILPNDAQTQAKCGILSRMGLLENPRNVHALNGAFLVTRDGISFFNKYESQNI